MHPIGLQMIATCSVKVKAFYWIFGGLVPAQLVVGVCFAAKLYNREPRKILAFE